MKKVDLNFVLFAVFLILASALIAGSIRKTWDARQFSQPAQKISSAHSIKNLAPRSPVTINLEIEKGKYENLLVKTVYSSLKLYADETLIYQCGQQGSYPSWMLDPPTLLAIVPLPQDASLLRFEYISPSQRTTMSVPALMAGTDGALMEDLFHDNSVLFVISLFFLLIGFSTIFITLFFWRKIKAFVNLGFFALAVGCWSFGECDLTAFLINYPTLLYIIALGGLFTITIPLLFYGIFILNPKNKLPMRITGFTIGIAVCLAFAFQLMGTASFSKVLPVFQLFSVFGLAIFAATAVWEHYKYKNKMARQFVPPALVLFAAAVLELINYSMRFTNVLSLFFLSGALIFTIWLGYIGMSRALAISQETERKAAKVDFYRKMSHNLRTPLTVISTNIQTAWRRPAEAGELLKSSQEEIMKIAEMINDVLKDSDDIPEDAIKNKTAGEAK